MYKQLIKIYLEIVQKLIDKFGKGNIENISEYDKIMFSKYSIMGFNILHDLRLKETFEKLNKSELPEDVVMFRLAKIAEFNEF